MLTKSPYQTHELLNMGVERILGWINLCESQRYNLPNIDGEVCNTNEFKAKVLLQAAIQLDPTLCNTAALSDKERSHIVYKIQEAEAEWLAAQCAKDHDNGVDVILCALRLPNNYDEMADSKLRRLQAIIDSDEEFDPTSLEVLNLFDR